MMWQMMSTGENWRVQARGDAWQSLEARGARDQPYRNFEWRMGVHAVSNDVEAFMVL